MSTKKKKRASRPAPAEINHVKKPPAVVSSPTKAKPMVEIPPQIMEELAKLRHIAGLYRNLIEDLKEEASEDESPQLAIPGRYTRGKLPGGELIRTDNQTGRFERIEQAEWDKLPWK